MDLYAILVLFMGVVFGFIRRGKEERRKFLEVLIISVFLGLTSATALSYLVLDGVGLGELVGIFGISIAAIIYAIVFIFGTYIGDVLEKFRK